jgi:hypothetical protein
MGIQDPMQEVDRTNSIQTSVWTGSNCALRISGTQSIHSNNYQHERKRHSIEEAKTTNGNGRGHDSSRISPGSTKIKGQILA